MIKTMNMPKAQGGMSEYTIQKWLKKVGDTVAKDEALFSIAVGKLAKTVGSEFSGVITEILVEAGSTVALGDPILVIDEQEVSLGGEPEEVQLVMPTVLAGAADSTVSKWFKKPGDAIAVGDVLVNISNGKLAKSIISEWNGTLQSIEVPAGETAPVGAVLGVVLGCAGAAASKKKDVSVIVIGGGPGGYVAAIRAAQNGAKVKLIEKKKLGGTCLNVGCIPTKALLHSAELYHQAKNSAWAGVNVGEVSLDWAQVQANRVRISETLTGGVAGLLDMAGAEVINGTATFVAADKIEVTDDEGKKTELTADKFIIATGSYPFMPPIPGIAGNPDCVDSTGALQMESLPKSMVLIGGGVIGVELACAYARFGTEVTIVEMLPRLLPTMDGELTEMAKDLLAKEGIKFSLETQVTEIEKKETTSVVHGKLKDGSAVSFEAEKILVAVGRRSYTEGLGLDAAGVKHDRGRILVNDLMETNVPNIYAIGDCNGQLMLAHTASVMGEVAAANATGGKEKFDPKSTPAVVYLFPDFAGVGMTGEQAEASGRELEIGRFPLAANGKALTMGETEGMIKVIADKRNRRILGVHILGAHGSDLIAEAALAIQMKATMNDVINTIHAHPSVGEAVREAVMAANGNPIHIH